MKLNTCCYQCKKELGELAVTNMTSIAYRYFCQDCKCTTIRGAQLHGFIAIIYNYNDTINKIQLDMIYIWPDNHAILKTDKEQLPFKDVFNIKMTWEEAKQTASKILNLKAFL